MLPFVLWWLFVILWEQTKKEEKYMDEKKEGIKKKVGKIFGDPLVELD